MKRRVFLGSLLALAALAVTRPLWACHGYCPPHPSGGTFQGCVYTPSTGALTCLYSNGEIFEGAVGGKGEVIVQEERRD